MPKTKTEDGWDEEQETVPCCICGDPVKKGWDFKACSYCYPLVVHSVCDSANDAMTVGVLRETIRELRTASRGQ